MNKIGTAILTFLLIIFGISLVMFVLRMIYSSPHPMGMMMGSGAFFHHMRMWIFGTFIIALFFVIIVLVLSFSKRKK